LVLIRLGSSKGIANLKRSLTSIVLLNLFASGCASFSPGHLVESISPTSVTGTDRLLTLNRQDGWYLSGIDGSGRSKLFDDRFHIEDVSPSRDSLVLMTWSSTASDDMRDSGLYIYDFSSKNLRMVPRPPSRYRYDAAKFSRDGKRLVASASMPYMWGNKSPVYDDRIYLVDLPSFHLKTLRNYLGDTQVGWVLWDRSGKKVFNSSTHCEKGKECWSRVLERDIEKDLILALGENQIEVRNLERQPALRNKSLWGARPIRLTECEGKTLKEGPIEWARSFTTHIGLIDQKGTEQSLATIEDRYIHPHSTRVQPLSPTFSSDCRYVGFSLNEKIYLANVTGDKKLSEVGRGNEFLFIPK